MIQFCIPVHSLSGPHTFIFISQAHATRECAHDAVARAHNRLQNNFCVQVNESIEILTIPLTSGPRCYFIIECCAACAFLRAEPRTSGAPQRNRDVCGAKWRVVLYIVFEFIITRVDHFCALGSRAHSKSWELTAESEMLGANTPLCMISAFVSYRGSFCKTYLYVYKKRRALSLLYARCQLFVDCGNRSLFRFTL